MRPARPACKVRGPKPSREARWRRPALLDGCARSAHDRPVTESDRHAGSDPEEEATPAEDEATPPEQEATPPEEGPAPASDAPELELGELEDDVRALRRRDRAFVFRLALRVGVAILLGLWIFLAIGEADVGSCAARGFGSVTG